jgi:hypothetical protein
MKKLFYFALAGSLFFTSCSKDDEPAPKTEATAKTELLVSQVPKVAPPAQMQNSTSEYAQAAYGVASGMSQVPQGLLSFTPPAGTEVSDQPLPFGNARMAEGSYLTYFWTQDGFDFAYQLFEGELLNILDLYYKPAGSDDEYVQYLHAEVEKDGKNGFYEAYANYSDNGEINTLFTFTFTWKTNSDNSINYLYDMDGLAAYDLLVNPDGSGTLKVVQFGDLFYESAWDASGNGWWKTYDYEGDVDDEGNF